MSKHILFFNDTATTEIYTLSLHDALPILGGTFEGVYDLVANRLNLPAKNDSGHFEGESLQFSGLDDPGLREDRKSTRLNSSHANISYAVFCLKKKKKYYMFYIRKKIDRTS